jgi:hypothetical protein
MQSVSELVGKTGMKFLRVINTIAPPEKSERKLEPFRRLGQVVE